MFSPPNALSKIKVSIVCPWFKPLDDRLAGNTLLAIVSISNLRNKSISKDDPAHALFTSFKPPTILTPKRSDVCFILTSWVLAYPNLTQIERAISIHGLWLLNIVQ
jgi:hypothetical protein